MKKLALFLSLALGLFGADAANDVILSQRNPANTGNIQRNVSPTARGFLTFDASKIPGSTTDLTYSTPTLSVPDAFNVLSAGSIYLTPLAASGNIYANFNANSPAMPFQGIQYIGPSGVENGILLDGVGSGTTLRLVGRRANGTFASPTALGSINTMLSIGARGYDGSAYSAEQATIVLFTSEAWDPLHHGTALNFNITPAGSTTIGTAMTLGPSSYLMNLGIAGVTIDRPSLGVQGIHFRTPTNMGYNDTEATGTVAVATINSWARPTTFTATNAVTYTDMVLNYFTGPISSAGNVTVTRSHTIGVVDSTPSSSSITGAVVVATTLGTSATSVGIGGGNINAGGTITSGSTVTAGGRLLQKVSALTYASPTSVDVSLGNVYTVTTVNATGSVTFNANSGGTSGQQIVFIITNDATSAKTITFGTNFVANGTLTASGANKVTTITFMSNGTNFYEMCRTVLP